jgi:hypothetical protein
MMQDEEEEKVKEKNTSDEKSVEASSPTDSNNKSVSFSILSSHSGSLITLNLINCSLTKLEIGEEFDQLLNLDLSYSKLLHNIKLNLPSLLHLNLSRTLINDFDLLKILPSLHSLKILKLIGCKNIRKIDPDSEEEKQKLYGEGGACMLPVENCRSLVDENY